MVFTWIRHVFFGLGSCFDFRWIFHAFPTLFVMWKNDFNVILSAKNTKKGVRESFHFSMDFCIDFGWFFHDFSMFFPYFWGIDFHIDFWNDFVWLSGYLRHPFWPEMTLDVARVRATCRQNRRSGSPPTPQAGRMLHAGHIKHLVCLLGHPRPPFGIVLWSFWAGFRCFWGAISVSYRDTFGGNSKHQSRGWHNKHKCRSDGRWCNFHELSRFKAAVTLYSVQYSQDGPFQIAFVCFLVLAYI